MRILTIEFCFQSAGSPGTSLCAMRKATIICCLFLLTGLACFVIRERAALAGLREENERWRRQWAELERAREASADVLRQQNDENLRLRADLGELARLRGETTRLRQELQAAAAAKKMAALTITNGALASAPEAESLPPIEKYTANVRARLAWNQTLITGGWRTSEGKRCLVFVEPQKIEDGEDPGAPRQLTVRTKFMELSDDLLAQLGLAKLASDKNESSSQIVLTLEQTTALQETLKQNGGVDILSAPEITTLSGRQAQIKVVDILKTASGKEYEVGPIVDVVPSVSPNGDFVDMTVLAQLNRRSK